MILRADIGLTYFGITIPFGLAVELSNRLTSHAWNLIVHPHDNCSKYFNTPRDTYHTCFNGKQDKWLWNNIIWDLLRTTGPNLGSLVLSFLCDFYATSKIALWQEIQSQIVVNILRDINLSPKFDFRMKGVKYDKRTLILYLCQNNDWLNWITSCYSHL